MNFSEFQKMNFDRSHALHPDCENLQYLAIAIAGESGELCNEVKKVMRGDFSFDEKREDILNEIADIVSYCDLLMSVLSENTEQRLTKKFNEVSSRWGYAPR